MDAIEAIKVLVDTRDRLIAGKDGLSSYDDSVKALHTAIARAAAAVYPERSAATSEDNIPF